MAFCFACFLNCNQHFGPLLFPIHLKLSSNPLVSCFSKPVLPTCEMVGMGQISHTVLQWQRYLALLMIPPSLCGGRRNCHNAVLGLILVYHNMIRQIKSLQKKDVLWDFGLPASRDGWRTNAWWASGLVVFGHSVLWVPCRSSSIWIFNSWGYI